MPRPDLFSTSLRRARHRWRPHAETETDTATGPGPRRRGFWAEHWPIVAVAAVGLLLRLFQAGRRVVIFDEYLLLNPYALPQGLLGYAAKVWQGTTYNPGWAVVVWVMNRLCGPSVFWSRFPSCLAGAGAVVAVYAAARAVGMSRRAGLAAGAVLALGVYQVEYGQQALPYAAMPLAGAFCLWLVTRLARPEENRTPARAVLLATAFVAAVGLAAFVHNSALILLPPLFAYWAWAAWRSPGGPGARKLQGALWLAGGVAVGFAVLGWFLAKLGESDREYLWAFFPGTFRGAPIRWFVSDLLNWTDDLYQARRGRLGAWAASADVAYFAASRLFDLVATQFRAEFLTGNLHTNGESARRLPWLFTLPVLAVCAAGAARCLVGNAGPSARRWAVCFAMTLALVLGFSALRMFPLGGVRQLLVLSPFWALAVAAAVDCRSRRLAGAAAAGLAVWAAGNLFLLPDYYRTTRSDMNPAKMKRLAQRFGVREIVAGDNLAALGEVALAAEADPSFRPLIADDAHFALLTRSGRPFFLCAISDPLFEKLAPKLVPTRFFDASLLRHYSARPVIRPKARNGWFQWYVYLMEPHPGAPYPPGVERVEVRPLEVFHPGKAGATETPANIFVWFTQPIKPGYVHTDLIHLTAESDGGRFEPSGNVPLRVGCAPGGRTVVIEPVTPLKVGKRYLLTLNKPICDLDGRQLDIDGWEYHRTLRINPWDMVQFAPKLQVGKPAE